MQGDFRIGECLVQPRINSIKQGGETIHLEPKVMQVLLVLASNPGEVVTREEIRKVVWPDVFVGDDVLMRAISEIRRVFRDDPRTPHTIQTVPKVGYRLIASVAQVQQNAPGAPPIDSPGSISAHPARQTAAVAAPTPSPVQLDARRSRPRPSWFAMGAVLVLAVLVLLLLMVAWAVKHRPVAQAGLSYISHPLTTYPGSQLQPAISPDGEAVAFVWRQTGDDIGHIYIKALNSGAPIRLTSGSDQEFSPAWSPDGRSLAFIRQSEHQSAVEVMPALGGSEQQVYILPVNSVWEYGGLTWTHNGSSLIFPQENTLGGTSQLVELSLNTRTVQPLTRPRVDWNGDWMPAISPDGTMLAFARSAERSTRDIFVMKLPDGTPHQLTSDAHMILGLTWTSDGASIVFSSNRGGSLGLWRVSTHGGQPEREPAGSDGAYWPSIARHGDILVYCHGNAIWSIAAIALGKHPADTETQVFTSSEQDASPQISPSGDRIAFQSWRSGAQEIWTSRIDGDNPVQLTNQGASAGSPAWSRDGRLLAFDARPGGFAHIYVIDANGGTPRALTSGSFNDVVPSWSIDGRWVYFGSSRSGSWQIWKTASNGQGPAQQVTSSGGMVAKESNDSKWLYFTQFVNPGIWRRSLVSGQEQKVFDGPPAGDQNYWTLYDNQLYTLAAQSKGYALVRVDPESGRSTPLYVLKHDPTPFAGLTITPDGKRLFFAELTEAESNLTLVEHFQ